LHEIYYLASTDFLQFYIHRCRILYWAIVVAAFCGRLYKWPHER